MEILVTAAPGGHSGYAYALGYYARMKGLTPHFLVPKGYSWIREKLSRLGETIEHPLPRKPAEPLWRTIHRWPLALLASMTRVTRRYKAVISCGANFSIPPSIAGKLKGLKLYNVESIVRILDTGKTPRLLYHIADKTFLHWPEQLKNYPKGLVVGPIYEPPTREPYDGGYILVTAGTLGNKELFDAVVELDLEDVVMQTGQVDPEPYRRRRPGWRYVTHTSDFDELLAGASVVVTQFPGMTSATAALAYRKPVVLVPARHLHLSASLENARIYAEKIHAVYVDEITPESLEDALEKARGIEPPSYDNGAEKAVEHVYNDIVAG
ncbi:MAG: polysaccharide biosynthesis protein [Desulfurococcales archaeon]|nr:polysaccharide biosynthesis protein [Desulfurococcales archaeon]